MNNVVDIDMKAYFDTVNHDKGAVGNTLKRMFLGFCLLAKNGVKIRPHNNAKKTWKNHQKKI